MHKMMLRQLATKLNELCPDFPMASVCPLSRPKVKFRACHHTIKSYHLRMWGHCQLAIMTVHVLIASTAMQNGLNLMHFDTESVPIKVDNCCSKCITNDIQDMIPSSIKQTAKIVKGFKGEQCAATCHGTICWSWDDDLGVWQTFRIPNSYYIPEATSKLLCLQHWAQEAADHSLIRHGTGCNTNDCCITLYWNQWMSKRTVPLDPSINVGILHSTTGYCTSDKQCQAMEAALAKHDAIYCHDAGITSDNDDEESSPSPPVWPMDDPEPQLAATDQQQIVFDLQGPDDDHHDQVNINEEDNLNELVASKMLREHHRLAHLPFSRMQAMACAGLLPHVFATCHKPICTACLYGKAARHPWRTKGEQASPRYTQMCYLSRAVCSCRSV